MKMKMGEIMEWIYPKGLFVVKKGNEKQVWKIDEDILEDMYKKNAIDEYEPLKVLKIRRKGD